MTDPVVTLGGLVLAGVEPGTGVRWIVPQDAIQGWWTSPAARMDTGDKPRAAGAWWGDAQLAARTVAIQGWVDGPTRAAVVEALARLARACALTDTLLTVTDEDGTLSATVRRADEVLVSWVNLTTAKWSIQMMAADPRRFGEPIAASTGLPSSSGGLTVPFTVPFSIAAAVVSGQVSLTNPGNFAGPVKLRIDGPVTGPVVTHVNSGRSLTFAASLALGAGEFVTVDMERKEVLAQGQASRNRWVTSRGWSAFEPGDNTWAFTSSGGASGGLLSVEAVPAWM